MTESYNMRTDIPDKVLQSNREVHQLEAPVYDWIHPEIFGRSEQRRVRRDIDLIASAMADDVLPRVLDTGCGTGNLTLQFAKLGWRVMAVDISPHMLRQLRSKLSPGEAALVDLVEGNAEDILANRRTYGTWDVVSFSSVLHHLPDYETALLHALRQLRPGGLVHVCHEPLQRSGSEQSLACASLDTVLTFADNLYIVTRKLVVYLAQFWRTRRFMGHIDYGWSDFHARSGIDPRRCLEQLEAAGGRTLLCETYRSRYCSSIEPLDSWFRLGDSHFRFIVQREDSAVGG